MCRKEKLLFCPLAKKRNESPLDFRMEMVFWFFNQYQFMLGCQCEIKDNQKLLKPQPAIVRFDPCASLSSKGEFDKSGRRRRVRIGRNKKFELVAR